MKTMLITIFDEQGVIYKEFVSEGQTVNNAFYVEALFPGEATVSSRGQLVLLAGQCPFPFRIGSEDFSGQTWCGDKPPTLFS
jgi:hypothetical protein